MNLEIQSKKRIDTIEILKYFICFLVLLSTCVMLQIPVSFTNSGIISFYLVEIVGIIAAVVSIIYYIKNKNKLGNDKKKLLIFTMAFAIYCFLNYALRIIRTGLELKSIIVIESNLFVIGLMFVILFKMVNVKIVMNTLCYFGAIFGISTIVLFYFAIDNNGTNVFFQHNGFIISTFGHAVRTYILGMIFPITAYSYLKSDKKIKMLLYYIHMFCLIFCGVISASRVNFIFIPALLIATSFILYKRKSGIVKRGISCLIISLLIIFASAPFSARLYAQLTRLSTTNYIITVCKIPYVNVSSSNNNSKNNPNKNNPNKNNHIDKEKFQDMVKAAEDSTEQSSSMRFEAWRKSIEDFKRNPLFGVGLQQYECTSHDGVLKVVIQPHNFVFEYVLSFGIIGFILWIMMIGAPIIIMLKNNNYKIFNNEELLFVFCLMIFACAGAFFQPYFIYSCVMAFVYIIIGCFYVVFFDEDIRVKIKN